MNIDLTIITVSYNDKDPLLITLQAIFDSVTSFNYEVIIVNNNSPDDSKQMVEAEFLSNPNYAGKITHIINSENLGFGKANNIGMRKSKGDYILLLNSDTKLDKDNLEVMLKFIKSRSDVGIATCKLVKANGELDISARRSEPDPKVAFYRLSGLQFLFPKKFGAYNVLSSDINKEGEIDACVGAYMLMPRKIFELTRGFDERFYHYGEDLDLCRQTRELGYKVWWYPKTSCIHYRGQSSKKTPTKALYAFHDVMWIYYDKWYRAKYSIFMDIFVYCGIWGRYYWKVLRNILRPRDKRFVSR